MAGCPRKVMGLGREAQMYLSRLAEGLSENKAAEMKRRAEQCQAAANALGWELTDLDQVGKPPAKAKGRKAPAAATANTESTTPHEGAEGKD
jgi:hypothetical protein